MLLMAPTCPRVRGRAARGTRVPLGPRTLCASRVPRAPTAYPPRTFALGALLAGALACGCAVPWAMGAPPTLPVLGPNLCRPCVTVAHVASHVHICPCAHVRVRASRGTQTPTIRNPLPTPQPPPCRCCSFGLSAMLTTPDCSGPCVIGRYGDSPGATNSSCTALCPGGRYGASEGLGTANCTGACRCCKEHWMLVDACVRVWVWAPCSLVHLCCERMSGIPPPHAHRPTPCPLPFASLV